MHAWRSPRFAGVIASMWFIAGCSRFVWHEDPFTPDAAPATDIAVAGSDTTYVLRGSAYYLLAARRDALWNRDVMDDVAWRYRRLFGDAPPTIAVRIDSLGQRAPDSTTWRGVPLANVAAPSVRARDDGRRRGTDRQELDSARLRLIQGPMLAATAAETWLRTRARESARTPDNQPGGPIKAVAPRTSATALPAWLEASVVRVLGVSGAVDRSTAEVRADVKRAVPLATLFRTSWPVAPSAAEIVGVDVRRIGDSGDVEDGPRRQGRRDGAGRASLFVPQSVAVLAFLHERDASIVARLIDETARGRSTFDVLASSATLPHDPAALEAAWQTWLRRRPR